jgi:hypothetical protein
MVTVRATPIRSSRAPNARKRQTGAPIRAHMIGPVRTSRPDARGLTPADARLSPMDFQAAPPAPAQ